MAQIKHRTVRAEGCRARRSWALRTTGSIVARLVAGSSLRRRPAASGRRRLVTVPFLPFAGISSATPTASTGVLVLAPIERGGALGSCRPVVAVDVEVERERARRLTPMARHGRRLTHASEEKPCTWEEIICQRRKMLVYSNNVAGTIAICNKLSSFAGPWCGVFASEELGLFIGEIRRQRAGRHEDMRWHLTRKRTSFHG